MSATIKLYSSNDSKEVIDKTLTEIATLSGNFREEMDILTPVVNLEKTNDATIAKLLTECNYFYIQDFSRYYYVTGIRAITKDVVELSGAVDVLKSWSTAIKAQKVIVARNEKDYSCYLDDSVLKVYNNSNITTLEFPSGFTSEEFVLAVAGG